MDGGVSIALIALTVAAAAASAYGAYSSAQAQQSKLKEDAARRREDAQQLQLAGEEAARRQRKKDQARLESFGAIAAARGVVAHEGSSLLEEMDFASQSELEAQSVKHGYELQARQARQQAVDAKWQAKRISPEMEMGKSLLASAGSIAGSYGTAGLGAQTGGGLTAGATNAGGSSSTSAWQSYRAGERMAY